MNLSNCSATGNRFQLTAKGQDFRVIGTTVWRTDKTQCEALINNLAEMLDEALIFAKLSDADKILENHGLVRDKG